MLILGLGGVGMQGFQMAKAMFGAAPCAADVRQDALDTVAGQGARAYNPAEPGAARAVKAESAMGTGVYAVIDFVGSEQSFAFATQSLRRGGTTVQVGLLGGAMSNPLPMFPIRALSIRGSLVGSIPVHVI